MFCGYCGKSVKDGSRFCVYCGKKLIEDELVSEQAQQPRQIRPDTYQTYRAASDPSLRNNQIYRQPGTQPSQGTRQPDMQTSQRPRQPGMQQPQGTRQTGMQPPQGTRQSDMQTSQRPRQPGMQPPQGMRQPGMQTSQGSGRHYFSSEQRIRHTELQTDEIMRQTDIQLEQRARQADIQREQEKLASDTRQSQEGQAEQGTGRIYDRRNDGSPDRDRQPFEGKRRRKGSAKKSNRLVLLIALIAIIAALGAAVWFFVIPMFTSSGAEDTIERLEEALNERDNDKLLKCFDRETNALRENAFSSGTARAGFDLKISETFESDAEHMTAYVTFGIRYNGNYRSVLVPLPMVKEGKTWFITKAGWDNVCAEIPTKN